MLLIPLALFTAAPAPAYAASFTVTTTADTDDDVCNANCSLREAIAAANTRPGRDTVTISAGVYLLALDQLSIDSDLTIHGAGADRTFIDGGGAQRVIAIQSGDVTISGVTIQNGDSNEGSGIDNHGRLRLQQSAVRTNHAGAIFAGIRNHAWLSITNSTLAGNTAETGGAFYNTGSGTATIVQSIIVDNTATHWGGAIRNSGTLRLRQTEILRNETGTDGLGGALYNGEGSVQLYLVTIAQNDLSSRAEQGGGVYNSDGATLLIDRSAVNDNAAALGGGIRNLGILTLRRSEVTRNRHTMAAGSITLVS
jgi:CSLREA domain-containing protein